MNNNGKDNDALGTTNSQPELKTALAAIEAINRAREENTTQSKQNALNKLNELYNQPTIKALIEKLRKEAANNPVKKYRKSYLAGIFLVGGALAYELFYELFTYQALQTTINGDRSNNKPGLVSNKFAQKIMTLLIIIATIGDAGANFCGVDITESPTALANFLAQKMKFSRFMNGLLFATMYLAPLPSYFAGAAADMIGIKALSFFPTWLQTILALGSIPFVITYYGFIYLPSKQKTEQELVDYMSNKEPTKALSDWRVYAIRGYDFGVTFSIYAAIRLVSFLFLAKRLVQMTAGFTDQDFESPYMQKINYLVQVIVAISLTIEMLTSQFLPRYRKVYNPAPTNPDFEEFSENHPSTRREHYPHLALSTITGASIGALPSYLIYRLIMKSSVGKTLALPATLAALVMNGIFIALSHQAQKNTDDVANFTTHTQMKEKYAEVRQLCAEALNNPTTSAQTITPQQIATVYKTLKEELTTLNTSKTSADIKEAGITPEDIANLTTKLSNLKESIETLLNLYDSHTQNTRNLNPNVNSDDNTMYPNIKTLKKEIGIENLPSSTVDRASSIVATFFNASTQFARVMMLPDFIETVFTSYGLKVDRTTILIIALSLGTANVIPNAANFNDYMAPAVKAWTDRTRNVSTFFGKLCGSKDPARKPLLNHA